MALVAASPVADRRISAGCKRLEEEVVVQSTKDGGMGENPPISSIVVCGRVGAVGRVGGLRASSETAGHPRGQYRRPMRRGRLKGGFDGFHRPEGGQRADAITMERQMQWR